MAGYFPIAVPPGFHWLVQLGSLQNQPSWSVCPSWLWASSIHRWHFHLDALDLDKREPVPQACEHCFPSLCSWSGVLNIMKYGTSSIPAMQKLHGVPQLKRSLKSKRKFYCNFYLKFDCFIAPRPPGEGLAKKMNLCATASLNRVLNAVSCCTRREKRCFGISPKAKHLPPAPNQDNPISP